MCKFLALSRWSKFLWRLPIDIILRWTQTPASLQKKLISSLMDQFGLERIIMEMDELKCSSNVKYPSFPRCFDSSAGMQMPVFEKGWVPLPVLDLYLFYCLCSIVMATKGVSGSLGVDCDTSSLGKLLNVVLRLRHLRLFCLRAQKLNSQEGSKMKEAIKIAFERPLFQVKMIVVIGCHTNTELLAFCNPPQINTVHYTDHCTWIQ